MAMQLPPILPTSLGFPFLFTWLPSISAPNSVVILRFFNSISIATLPNHSASFRLLRFFPFVSGSAIFFRRTRSRLAAHSVFVQSRSLCLVAKAGPGGNLGLSDDAFLRNLSYAQVEEEGPIELPTELDPFEIPAATPIQTVASIFLTGTIAVLLFRSLRRRSQRAKKTRFRSYNGAQSIVEQARKVVISNAAKSPEIQTSKPNAGQVFVGGIIAGVIALILYKFTASVEEAFAAKPLSTNYSIRQLTITIRTIINGLCYLATFVFAANAIGLTLYSLQLVLDLDLTPPPPTNEISDFNADTEPVKLADDSNVDSKSFELSEADKSTKDK